ncbi:MAG: hypothetical protein KDD29_04980 [Flavobacteriales bacterium]|nr:hypothetical protein [Flavobacteriales bacterium]
MTPTKDGRFCSICQKNVFDYRGKDISEIRNKYDKSESCGRFSLNQIETDIIKEIRVPKLFKTLTIFTFLSLVTDNVSGQTNDTTKTEQTINSNDKKTSKRFSKNALKKESCNEKISNSNNTDLRNDREKKVWYLTKRFPFIKRRKRYSTTGRFL